MLRCVAVNKRIDPLFTKGLCFLVPILNNLIRQSSMLPSMVRLKTKAADAPFETERKGERIAWKSLNVVTGALEFKQDREFVMLSSAAPAINVGFLNSTKPVKGVNPITSRSIV